MSDTFNIYCAEAKAELETAKRRIEAMLLGEEP